MKGIEEFIRVRAMYMSTTAGGSRKETTWCRQRLRSGSRRPSHVLFNVEAVAGFHRNRTTATTLNSKGGLIKVTFLLKRPPQPSTVFVASDELNPFHAPVVLCAAADLLLLRVNVGTKDGHLSLKHYHDYYVYRASAPYPALHLLPSPPNPVFHRDAVGVLPRPDGHYTVAGLMDVGRNDAYELQLYHSDGDTNTWTARQVFVQPPHWNPLPDRIPKYCGALLRHYTSAVVTIGGDSGTMAFVDLWWSVFLCDVLRPDPCLRGVPVPLPATQMSLNGGLGVKLDFAAHSRGISFNRDTGCLVLVHIERTESPPVLAAARGLRGQEVKVLDWEVTTWSNSKMSGSPEDWHEERSVPASGITIDDPAVARMLERSGLPCRPPPPRDHKAAADAAAQAQQQLELHNLSMCQPALCPNGEDNVVYLVAREKYLHPKCWFVAVDMKNKGTLKHVAYIGNQDHPFCHRIYWLSRISKYTNVKLVLKTSATGPAVCVEEEESNYQSGAVK